MISILAGAHIAFAATAPSEKFTPTMLDEPYYSHYGPFVFTQYEDYAYDPTFLTAGETYVPGRLYLKDYLTGEITLLLDREVSEIGCWKNRVYCLIGCNEIGIVDLDNFQYTRLFIDNDASMWRMIVGADMIYYADGDTICTLRPSDGMRTTVGLFPSLQTYYPLNNNEIAWVDLNDVNRVFHIPTGNNTTYDTYESMFGDMFDVPSPNAGDVGLMANLLITNPALPLKAYPSGSYFTDNGGPCSDHDAPNCGYESGCVCNCKNYRNSIQCMSFAKYVCDKFAHIPESGFDTYHSSSHFVNGKTVSFTDSQLKSLTIGTYIRRYSSLSASSGTHSLVIIGNTGGTLTVYHANTDGRCKVSVQSFTYAEFRTKYGQGKIYAHSFTGTPVYYDDLYHKVKCTKSGCPGYMLTAHTSTCGCKNSVAAKFPSVG